MAFNGTRQGFNISTHLNRKSSEHLRYKLRRLKDKHVSKSEMSVVHVCLGILASRGERFQG